MAFEFTDSNFKDTALSGGIAVVDFWAEWCGPCKLIGPIVEDLAHDFEGKVTIGKMNVDDNLEIPTKYAIRSIPTILIIKDGEVVDKHVGATTKAILAGKINAQLS